MATAQSALATPILQFGNTTPIGSLEGNSRKDLVTMTEALTSAGTVTTGFSIPAGRVEYSFVNGSGQDLSSWTLNYSSSLAPLIIGSLAPTGYVNSAGTFVNLGGSAYDTLFNAGFGTYTYNTGSHRTIDYEADHVTWATTGGFPSALPDGAGVGDLLNSGIPIGTLPFEIFFSPGLATGSDTASAIAGSSSFSGDVTGPVPVSTTVPDGGTTLAMLGLALGGMAAVRRKLGVA